ncbi:hypothetical protein X777_14663 [Ooceraea biroi]|uniref:Uncharacterized protein n=1 Tax=Ooceraea biroi TaxID=2015173 RepID=A0A026WTS4_OOCBI|nr:hypothetical protein X777_14663 [Ooceraea biroi]
MQRGNIKRSGKRDSDSVYAKQPIDRCLTSKIRESERRVVARLFDNNRETNQIANRQPVAHA